MISKKTKLYRKVKGHIETYLNSNKCSIPFDYEGLRNIIYDESLKVTKNHIKKDSSFKYKYDAPHPSTPIMSNCSSHIIYLPEPRKGVTYHIECTESVIIREVE